MATFTRPDVFSKNLCDKLFDLDSDQVRWVFSNSAPVAGSTNQLSNVTQIATGGGFTQADGAGAGGILATLNALSQTGASTNVGTTGNVFTATGAVGTFQYIILFSDTSTNNLVIGWLNHGSAITMANTDTYTIPSGNLLVVG